MGTPHIDRPLGHPAQPLHSGQHGGPLGAPPAVITRLRDDARADEDVLAYISQENAYAAAVMNETKALQVGAAPH